MVEIAEFNPGVGGADMSGRTKGRGERVEYGGRSLTWREWAAITGIEEMTLRHRVQRLGWTAERALTEPVKEKRQRGQEAPEDEEGDWPNRLRLAIARQAAKDFGKAEYRAGVEAFFRGAWFRALFDLPGEDILARLTRRR